MLKAQGILQIISKSKSPNFTIIKQAYIYGEIKSCIDSYVTKELDIENLDAPYIVYSAIKRSILTVTIRSEVGYMTSFLLMNKDELYEFLFSFLRSKGVLQYKKQLQLIV